MESSDTFTQTAPEDDPFAGSDFGDFDQSLPVVDREGNPVAPPGLPTLSPEQAKADAAAYREEKGEPEPHTPPIVAEEPQAAPKAPQTAEEPQAAPKAPQTAAHVPQDGASVESQEGDGATSPPEVETPAVQPVERTERTEVEPERAAEREEVEVAGKGGPQIEQPVQPDPESAAEQVEEALSPDDSQPVEDDKIAPPPAEKKDKNNRVTHRKYVILGVDGPDKFTRQYWYEDNKGNLAARHTPGARKQGVVLARNTEDALKFGFAAVGAPQDGVTLVAVAELYFQPKRIKPKAPEPLRQRLEIG